MDDIDGEFGGLHIDEDLVARPVADVSAREREGGREGTSTIMGLCCSRIACKSELALGDFLMCRRCDCLR